jgi:hypothetical protein
MACGKSRDTFFFLKKGFRAKGLDISKTTSENNKKTIIFLEFRTIKDPLMKKGLKISRNERFFTHYRRFINTRFIKNNFEIII